MPYLLSSLPYMRKFLLFSLVSVGSLLSAVESVPMDWSAPKGMIVNNRVLLKVNGKAISVLDVVRKMDLLFYRQFPDLSTSLVARYQFYTNSWQTVLMTVIDEQLMLADAAEKKIEVTDGDIREEIENLFGPNVVANIDKVGLTFAEARELIKNELIVRKMTGMMVRSKAVNEISPLEIRKRYEAYVKANPVEDEWDYRILSIRSVDPEKGSSVASLAYSLLEAQKAKLEELPKLLEAEGITVSLSERYARKESELSLAYKAILQTVAIGKASPPTMQTVKEGEAVTRLFILEEHKTAKQPTLAELEGRITREITEKAIGRHNYAYLTKLRAQYGITEQYISEMIPAGFQPFTVQ